MTALHQPDYPGPAETPASNARRAGAPNHPTTSTGGTGDVTPTAREASSTARHDDASGVPLGLPDRAVQVAAWAGWHLFEITAMTVTALAAVTVTAWAWLLAVLVAIGWTAHEMLAARARRGEAARFVPDGTAGREVS